MSYNYFWPASPQHIRSQVLVPWASGLLMASWDEQMLYNFASGYVSGGGVSGSSVNPLLIIQGPLQTTSIGFVAACAAVTGAGWAWLSNATAYYAPASGTPSKLTGYTPPTVIPVGAAYAGGNPYFVEASGTVYLQNTNSVTAVSGSFGEQVSAITTDGTNLYGILPASDKFGKFTFSGAATGTATKTSIPITTPACIGVSGGDVAVGGWTPTFLASGANSLSVSTDALHMTAVETSANKILLITGSEPSYSITQSVSGTGAPVFSVWASTNEQVLVSDTTNNSVEVFNLISGSLVLAQNLTVSGAAQMAVTPDGLQCFVCQGSSVAVLKNNTNVWSSVQTISTNATSVMVLSQTQVVFGISGGLAYYNYSGGSWVLGTLVGGMTGSPSALATDGNGTVYAVSTNAGTAHLYAASTTAILGSTSWTGTANSLLYSQLQIAVVDGTNNNIRFYSYVNGAFTLQNTMSIGSGGAWITTSVTSVWVCETSQIAQYFWGPPYSLLQRQTGLVGIYNGSSWSTITLGTAARPSSLTWDVSGSVWVSTVSNNVYQISASGASIIQTLSVTPYSPQPSTTSLGLVGLVWQGGHLWGSCVLNGAVVQVV